MECAFHPGKIATAAVRLFPSVLVDHDQEQHRFAAARITDGVRHVDPVAGGIARAEHGGVVAGLQFDLAFFDGQEFPRPPEVGCTLQLPVCMQLHFVELDILFQVQRGERADTAFVVRTIMEGAIVGPDDFNRGRGDRCLDQFAQGDAESLLDADGDRQSGIGFPPLDLAQHGSAHATGSGEGIEGPAPLLPQGTYALRELPADLIGGEFGSRSVGSLISRRLSGHLFFHYNGL